MNRTTARLLVLIVVAAILFAACAPTAAPSPTAAPATPAAAATTQAPAATTQAPAGPTAAPAAAPAAAVPGVTADKVKLGTFLDMSGPVASVHVPFYRAYDTWVKMVNDEGGIAGRKIELIAEDDKYTVPLAQAAYKKLTTSDGVFAIVGAPDSSDQPPVILPTSEKEGVITFGSMIATAYQLTPFREWHFTTQASYIDQASVMSDYALSEIKKKGEEPRVAIVVIEVASGKEIAGYFEEALKRVGAKPVTTVVLPSTSTDATAQVQQLKSANPNYILFHASLALETVLVKSMEKAGYKVPIVSTFGSVSDAFWKGLNPEFGALGVGVQIVMPPYSDGPAFEKMRQMAEKYGNGQYANSSFFAQGWISAMVWFEGMKRAGKDLTRASMRAALESIKDFDTGGISAPVTFSATNHHGVRGQKIFTYDYTKQKVVPITDWLFPAKR